MRKAMSFSDRQILIQHMAVVRNLTVELGSYEKEPSPLLQRCEEMQHAVDLLAGELIGDASYFILKEHPPVRA